MAISKPGSGTSGEQGDGRITVDRGFMYGYFGNVNFVYMGNLDDKVYAHYLDVLDADLCALAPTSRRLVLYESAPGDNEAMFRTERRKALAEILNKHEKTLGRSTLGYAFVTTSLKNRGILTAVFWLAPPPYPTKVVGKVDDAIAWLRTKDETLDVAALKAHYRQLKLKYREQTGLPIAAQ